MLACLQNIISFKRNCDVQPISSSGINLDDLGITVAEADDYISEQYESGADLLDAKISFATEKTQKIITAHFSDSIISRSLLENKRLGQFQDNLQQKSGSAGILGGQHIEFTNYNSYFNLFVSEISLQTAYTGSIDVFVYDLIQNKLIDTIQIDSVAGEISTKYVNKTYRSDKKRLDLIFVYDTSSVNSYFTSLDFAGCASCVGYKYSNGYLNAWGITTASASQKIKSSLSTNSHTSGMSIVYSVQCDNESWLCSVANLLALPIAYQTAAEVMSYSIFNSTRGNTNQTLYYERNKERMYFYENKFNKYLNEVINKISLPQNDICFSCYTPVKNVIVLP